MGVVQPQVGCGSCSCNGVCVCVCVLFLLKRAIERLLKLLCFHFEIPTQACCCFPLLFVFFLCPYVLMSQVLLQVAWLLWLVFWFWGSSFAQLQTEWFGFCFCGGRGGRRGGGRASCRLERAEAQGDGTREPGGAETRLKGHCRSLGFLATFLAFPSPPLPIVLLT